MSMSLYGVIEEGNKFAQDFRDVWELRISGLSETVGLVPIGLVSRLVLDTRVFALDKRLKTILVTPAASEGEDAPAATRRAFIDLVLTNGGNLNGVFDRWIAKAPAQRDFHCILNTDERWLHLSLPTPARGLFGVVTAGVHLNVYTVKVVNGRERIDKIWVSQRASGPKYSYPGMLDQIVAGGIDPADRYQGRLAPFLTLKREAKEEAGLDLDVHTRNMVQIRQGVEWVIGEVCEAEPIMFYDQKGDNAGRTERGHLEPGVRFVYDLKVDDAGFQPQRGEPGVEKFESFYPDEVKTQLRNKRWKPNCGLVMLDFLMRTQLVTRKEEHRFDDIQSALRRPLPFTYTQQGMPFMASWDSMSDHHHYHTEYAG